MTQLLDVLFSPAQNEAPPQIAAPSAVETAAQKTQDDLTQAREAKEARDADARSKVIAASSAGAQTLFKREGEIPKAVRLGGGART